MELLEGVAAEVASGLHVEATLDVLQSGEAGPVGNCERPIRLNYQTKANLLVKLAAEVNGTGHGSQLGEVDGRELVVTSNLEATIDGLELRHADVGDLGVVDEDQVTSLGQVGGSKGGEAVTPETELTGELLEGRNGDGADVTEGHVLTARQVGQLNLQRVEVTGEVDETSGVLQVVHVDRLQLSVLGDIEGLDLLEGDSVQAGETSVGDGDAGGLSDTLAEVESLQVGEGGEGDLVDRGQGAEAEGGEGSQTAQLEGGGDGLQAGAGQGGHVGSTLDGQTAIDLLDAVQVQVTGVVLADLDVTLDGLAAGVAVGIGLVLDFDGITITAV